MAGVVREIMAFLGRFSLIFTLLLASFILNVYVHEVGHHVTASVFDLDPEMHFLNPLENGATGFTVASLQSEPVAYVAFSPTSSDWELVSVALAGVFWNAILGLVFTYFYVQLPYSENRRTLYLALVIPCLLAIFINLNIFNPLSDGHRVLEVLHSLR